MKMKLDLEKFEIVEVHPQISSFDVVILKDRRAGAVLPWCLEYKGSGHYFRTREELDAFFLMQKYKMRSRLTAMA